MLEGLAVSKQNMMVCPSYVVGRPNFWRSGTPTVSVVIPVLDEAENLPHVLPGIPSFVDEVLLVDGHSTDGTVRVARKLRPDIRIVQQRGRGKGAGVAGIR